MSELFDMCSYYQIQAIQLLMLLLSVSYNFSGGVSHERLILNLIVLIINTHLSCMSGQPR